MGTAIVAIPKQDDYVWNISSEKIPHMTLLFLGDLGSNPELPRIEEFVAHVAKMVLPRFSMTVEKRDTLGPDNADVVFFEDYNIKMLNRFRENLLANQSIKQAWDSIPQYEEWTPHLTLGYPTAPAKKDPREYPGVSWVNFDKIAIWTGDFEGPTFDLESGDNEVMSMSGAKAAGNVLKHFGVRGMRWGVRRSSSQLSGGSAPSSASKPNTPDGGSNKAGGGGSDSHKSPEAQSKHATQRAIKRHGTDAVNNKDLQDLVNRINLERKYTDLFPKNKTKLQKGKDLATKILLNVGEDAATKLGKGIADKKIKKFLAEKTLDTAKTVATTKVGAEMTTLLFKKGFKTGFAP